jgi:hypothetical protein
MALGNLQIQLKAEWLLDLWNEKPSLFGNYQRAIAAIRKHFECGQSAAEQAHRRAREILSERASDPKRTEHLREWVEKQYLELAERAEKRGDLGEKRKTLDSLARLRGLSAPEQIEIKDTTDLAPMDDMTDEELAVAAKIDRRKSAE